MNKINQATPHRSQLLSEEDVPLRAEKGPTHDEIRLEDAGCSGEVPVMLESTDPQTGEIETITAYKSCNRKGCPDCGPKLRRRFAAHHIEQLEQKVAQTCPEQKVWALTLTTQYDLSGTLEERLMALAERRKKYLQKLRYRSEDLSYLWVAETGDRQRAHLHLLICADLTKDQLKRSWMKVGGGMINHAKEVKDHDHLVSTVWYMSKEQFCIPELNEAGFPGHTTNGHSRNIDGYSSEKAKEVRSQYARETVVQELLDGNVNKRPVCDEKAFRMYLRRILPTKVGEEVLLAGRDHVQLLDWEESRAVVGTENGKRWVDAYQVFPVDEPIPRLYEGTRYDSLSGGGTFPEPDVEPSKIPGSEGIFRFEDEDGSVHHLKVENRKREGRAAASSST